MERMTYKENGKWRLRIGDTEFSGKEADRLAAYEDTGLAPEDCAAYKKFEDNLCASGVPFSRIIELVNAEKEGRMVALPCNVGDKVWFIKFAFSYAKQPIPAMVCGLKTFSNAGTFTFMALTDENNISRSFINQDIGKTVFLTRKEAEAKLKETQEDESGYF